jgi:hypothetical protein
LPRDSTHGTVFSTRMPNLGGRDLMKKMEKPKPKGRKPAEGDRRQFLTTMDPEVIKGVKLAAIEDDTTASIVLETAAREWLERRGWKAKKT